MRSYLIQVYAYSYRNILFAKRNVYVLVEMLFWPIMGILSIGLMGGFLKLGSNTLDFVLTGAIASGALQVTQLDVSYSLMYDVWSKSMKHTFLSPAPCSASLLGAWFIGILRGTSIFFILTFLSRIFFDFKLPPLASTIMFLLGIYWMSLILGIVVWIFILRYGQRAEITVWALAYLVMVLCGVYYPVNLFPSSVEWISKGIPLTYFLDAIRVHYGFPLLFSKGLWIGWFLNLFYVFIGIVFVNTSIERSRRNGLLLKLSE